MRTLKNEVHKPGQHMISRLETAAITLAGGAGHDGGDDDEDLHAEGE